MAAGGWEIAQKNCLEGYSVELLANKTVKNHHKMIKDWSNIDFSVRNRNKGIMTLMSDDALHHMTCWSFADFYIKYKIWINFHKEHVICYHHSFSHLDFLATCT